MDGVRIPDAAHTCAKSVQPRIPPECASGNRAFSVPQARLLLLLYLVSILSTVPGTGFCQARDGKRIFLLAKENTAQLVLL